ncbi:MAG TPA: hypothetical protein GXX37_08405 [Clostridiaceae bacterium]|jgi:hypothetical protein|nr:hypothetical protein [Clostridiaceae bacterium]
MDYNKRPSSLRLARYYLINALKFYEMKNERLTPIIFVILLFTGLIGGFITEAAAIADNVFAYIVVNIIVIFILNIASTVYLHSYITEIKGGVASLRESLRHILNNFIKIIFAHLTFVAIIIIGLLLLVIPAIIFNYMFMFYICYLVDKDMRIKDALNASKNITTGKRFEIFVIYVLFNLIIFLPYLIAVMMASFSGNNLIVSFVLTFFSSVIVVMQQRLTALIYYDLEYGGEKTADDDYDDFYYI